MSRRSKSSESAAETLPASRREVLRRLAIALGAGALIQPNGGVLGFQGAAGKKAGAKKKGGYRPSYPKNKKKIKKAPAKKS